MSRNFKILGVGVLILLMWGLTASWSKADFVYTEPEQFKKYNPDGVKGEKYEFVKSYLNALKYLYLNEQEEETRRRDIFSQGNSQEKAKGYVKNLREENVNYRTARNLLKKYKTSENGLMLKVTDMFTEACDQLTEMNDQERQILEALLVKPKKADMNDWVRQEIQFKAKVKNLAAQRKNILAKVLEASLLVNKVLISSNVDEHGEFVNLGVTSPERKKLLAKITEFYDGKYYDKLKEGQSFLDASISSINKMLADKTWGDKK